MSSTGKPGLLGNLPNPAVKKALAQPIVVPPGAEEAFGLNGPAIAADPMPPPRGGESEKAKTFFLPVSVCERLEMQKLSERREMKHIVRQALDEYFAKNPVRAAVREVFR